MNDNIESSQEGTTSFLTSENFHGQPYVWSSYMRLSLVSLSFDQWSSLEAYKKRQYILTAKSNRCIIFMIIAALSTSKLLVTLKCSLGPV